MAKIALVQAMNSNESYGFYLGHLGISFISHFLKSKGHEVLVADRAVSSAFLGEIYDFSPDFIGLNATADSSQTFMTAKILRAILPEVPLVIGGPYVALNPEKTMHKSQADIGVIGDGIPTLQKIIEGNMDVKGIVLREGERISVNNFAPYAMEEWQIDPSVMPQNRYQIYPFIASMGCNGHCSYCTEHLVSPKISFRPLEGLVGDIESLRATREISWLEATDSNFLISKKRFADILEAFRVRGFPKVGFQARADDILKAKDELTYYKGSLMGVEVGIESFLEEQLSRWDKGITPEQNIAAIELLRGLGIRTYINLILGDLGVEESQMLNEFGRTIEFFSEHPEYIPLVTGVNLMIYDGKIEGYSVIAKRFLKFFGTIASRNLKYDRGQAHEAFHAGQTVPAKSKKIMADLLGSFYQMCIERDGIKGDKDSAILVGAFSNLMYDFP